MKLANVLQVEQMFNTLFPFGVLSQIHSNCTSPSFGAPPFHASDRSPEALYPQYLQSQKHMLYDSLTGPTHPTGLVRAGRGSREGRGGGGAPWSGEFGMNSPSQS